MYLFRSNVVDEPNIYFKKTLSFRSVRDACAFTDPNRMILLELIKEIELIQTKLHENYNQQILTYQNFDLSHKERTIASSVIEKYVFLNGQKFANEYLINIIDQI